MIEEEAVFTDPDVRQYRTKIARLESDFSKLASGLAVTGFEMADRKKWSPYAEGISQEERENRLENLQEMLVREKTTFEQYYPEYALPEGAGIGMVGGGEETDTGYPTPETEEDFAELPDGTLYIDPDDGQVYRK